MTKEEFYREKTVVRVDWYLSECDLPELVWARRRTFDDGAADTCFDEGGKIFGFDSQDYAGYILSEDEYRQLAGLHAEDEAELGIRLAELSPPQWEDGGDQDFEYLGKY